MEAAEKQMKKLWHTTNIYLHPKIHEYAEQLASKLPGNLKVCRRADLKSFFSFRIEHNSKIRSHG